MQIVRTDRSMEQIVFPIPEICEYLPSDSKHRVLQNAEMDDQGSKVADFFSRLDNLFHEMKWQKKLRGICSYNSCNFCVAQVLQVHFNITKVFKSDAINNFKWKL